MILDESLFEDLNSARYTVITQPETNEEYFENLFDATEYFDKEVKDLSAKGDIGEKKSVEIIDRMGHQISYWSEESPIDEDLTDKALQDLEDKDKNYELDKQADREAKVELAKQGVIKEEYYPSYDFVKARVDIPEYNIKKGEQFPIIDYLPSGVQFYFENKDGKKITIWDNDERFRLIGENLKEDLSQEEQKEYGVNTLINELVKSEYDAIDEYNSAIVTLESENLGEYTDVIRSIIEDERHHIGNLQEIMNRITPGTEQEFEKGKEEAIKTLAEEPSEITEEYKGKKLTKEEIKKIALDNYDKGGDVVYETWDDKDIEDFINNNGTKKELLNIFKKYHSVYLDSKAQAYDANHLIPDNNDEEDDIEDYPNDFRPDEEDEEDYGPGNPWDAPWMSIRDFIRI